VNAYVPPPGYYSVADIAKIRGTDHAAAWRFLSRNAGKHFSRHGRIRVISKERYRQLAMADYIDDKFTKLEAKHLALSEWAHEEIRRLEALVRSLVIRPRR
jgi:hypothetical protein